MKLHELHAKYTYGGFMDLGALPSTIDFQGPNGATSVSYTHLDVYKRQS